MSGAKKLTVWDLIEWHKKTKDSLANIDSPAIKTARQFHTRAVESLLALERKVKSAVVESVADFVEPFDEKVDHPWRLSDVIRFKFNMFPDHRVRINHAAHNARERAEKSRFKTLPEA